MGTASKLFSLTGWRVGWLIGSEEVIRGCRALHGFNTYCAPTPLQYGIARALDAEAGDFDGTAALMRENAEMLTAALAELGANAYVPGGGYFVVADVSPLGYDSKGFSGALLDGAKVACVPMNMFYSTAEAPLTHKEAGLVRFAICKRKEVVVEAIQRIQKFFADVKQGN